MVSGCLWGMRQPENDVYNSVHINSWRRVCATRHARGCDVIGQTVQSHTPYARGSLKTENGFTQTKQQLECNRANRVRGKATHPTPEAAGKRKTGSHQQNNRQRHSQNARCPRTRLQRGRVGAGIAAGVGQRVGGQRQAAGKLQPAQRDKRQGKRRQNKANRHQPEADVEQPFGNAPAALGIVATAF